MTEQVKDFDKLPELDVSPSGAFKLGGRVWHVRNASQMPWTIWPAMPKKPTNDDVREYVISILERVVVLDEAEEFVALVRSNRSPLTEINALPLLRHATELVTGRPTTQSSSSEDGLQATPAKSGGASSSPGTRKRRSRS